MKLSEAQKRALFYAQNDAHQHGVQLLRIGQMKCVPSTANALVKKGLLTENLERGYRYALTDAGLQIETGMKFNPDNRGAVVPI